MQRLFQITYLLTEHGSMTARELAERFGVSSRTIYRDIDALSAAGIPVYAEKGRGGGIRLLPDYVLDRTLFTEEEQAHLVNQMGTLASLQAPDSRALYDKLAAMFGHREPWLEVDFAPWAQGDGQREVFRMLRGAILGNAALQFTYTGADGTQTVRQVEPAKILFRNQAWYLYGWCRMREAWRVFKLARMRECTLTGEMFSPRENPPPPLAQRQQPQLEDAVLRFHPREAYRVYDDFTPAQVETLPDGRLEVHCLLAAGEAYTLSWLAGYGAGVEIVLPETLRKSMVKMLEKAMENYK